MKKKILFILRSTPYGSALAQEGVDAVLAASVFEQEISVLFMDEGVWQLHIHQQGHHRNQNFQLPEIDSVMERKNISAQLESFPLYEIDRIYADKKSLRRFSLLSDELILNPLLVGDKAIRKLISEHDVILSY